VGKGATENIILIGFSYTGKTRVGQEVAKRMGWKFIDTDDEIVKLSGKPIAEIFADDGEKHFRKLERQVLAAVCRGKGAVVSTGGGVIKYTANRRLMTDNGVVVCLEAKPATIYRRLLMDAENDTEQEVRPLLAVADPMKRIRKLKKSRQSYYALADWTVQTDNLTVEEAAEEVIHGWEKRGGRLDKKLAGELYSPLTDIKQADSIDYGQRGYYCTVATAVEKYRIFVGWGVLDQLGKRMKEVGLEGRAHIISDDQVFPIYGGRVQRFLEEAGYAVDYKVVPNGERSKSFETAVSIYDWLVEQRAERSDSIVALGGGVIGDLAGFVASTFLRGMPFVQVPTSLMAMVDSSIGGKVAVNHPEAKNLIGAFYQPRLVITDPLFLTTLPKRELVSGWAEVIKHAMIRDPYLLQLLDEYSGDLMKVYDITSDIVARSAAIKAAVVSEDEKESGIRTILNYGHTIAHGLEAASEYDRFSHGEAVAIGMTGASSISNRMGLLSQENVEWQKELLIKFGLPVGCADVNVENVIRAIELDKKSKNARTRWVLLADIGQTLIRDDVPGKTVRSVLSEILKS